MFRIKRNIKYRIALTKALKWKIQGVDAITFDSYIQARNYRKILKGVRLWN